jgi:hypothetical protein
MFASFYGFRKSAAQSPSAIFRQLMVARISALQDAILGIVVERAQLTPWHGRPVF